MLGSLGSGGHSKNETVITKKTKIKEKHRIVDPQYHTDPNLYQQPHLLGNQPVMGPHMIQPRNKSYSSSSSSSNQDRGVIGNVPRETLIPPQQNVLVTDPNMMNTGLINPEVRNLTMANQGVMGQGMRMPEQDLKLKQKKEIDKNGEKISIVEKVKQKFRHN